jgi:hypothetical protein
VHGQLEPTSTTGRCQNSPNSQQILNKLDNYVQLVNAILIRAGRVSVRGYTASLFPRFVILTNEAPSGPCGKSPTHSPFSLSLPVSLYNLLSFFRRFLLIPLSLPTVLSLFHHLCKLCLLGGGLCTYLVCTTHKRVIFNYTTMADLEKKRSSSSGSDEKVPTNNQYVEHVSQEEETLHRGLKARQVSLLAIIHAIEHAS